MYLKSFIHDQVKNLSALIVVQFALLDFGRDENVLGVEFTPCNQKVAGWSFFFSFLFFFS